VTKKTIYIARHGQTDYNLQGIVQGSGVDSDLNETGLLQASKLYEKYSSHPLELIITSALKRTIQTAEFFIQKPTPHKIYSAFNEIDWGHLEGIKPTPEDRRTFYQITQAWKKGNHDLKIKGGESPLEVQQRMKPAIEELIEESGNNILLVSHGRAMRILLCTMLRLDLSQMDDFPHTNTSVYQLEWTKKGFELKVRNNTDHLV